MTDANSPTTGSQDPAPQDPVSRDPAPQDPQEMKRLARDMMIQWDKQLSDMKKASNDADWSKTDWSKLNPKDVGVRFGPPMTEEQFAEYKKHKNVTLLRGAGQPR